MGLDMYLKGKKFLSNYSSEDKKAKDSLLSQMHDLQHLNGIMESSMEVSVELAYWRKANAIHNWFVREVQNGVDNCGEYWVSRDHLDALRHNCSIIIANPSKAPELLPTGSGFFFGSTEYDDWYMDTIEYTRETIGNLLVLPMEWSFVYQSSW